MSIAAYWLRRNAKTETKSKYAKKAYQKNSVKRRVSLKGKV